MNLSRTEYELLALVASHERSGREIAKLLLEETGKTISYGTLYTTFRRLKECGYVKSRDDEDDDGRVRFFNITGTGADSLDETKKEYLRLAFLVPA